MKLKFFQNFVLGKNEILKLNTIQIHGNVILNLVKTKMKQSPRIRAPHESKKDGKWTSVKKITSEDNTVLDKKILDRQIFDPVWIMKEYKPQLLSIEEAIKYHKELARPEMFNNSEGYLYARLLLDMHTKKKNKFLDNVKGSVYYPNFFSDGFKKEIIAICKKEEEIKACLEAGALLAGYEDILKKFEQSEIIDQSYDIIVCTPETYADLMALKKKINNDKLPNKKTNTITEDIAQYVKRFHLSKNFETSKISDEKGILKTKFGTLNMEDEKLAENFAALINAILGHRTFEPNKFITDCVVYAAPSTEKFKIDISRFLIDDVETQKHNANEPKDNNIKRNSVNQTS